MKHEKRILRHPIKNGVDEIDKKAAYEFVLNEISNKIQRDHLVVLDRRENAPKDYTFAEHEVAGKSIQAWVV